MPVPRTAEIKIELQPLLDSTRQLLDLVEGSRLVAEPESAAAVNVREIRRAYDRERKLPRKLVAESARVTALAQQGWADAREASDYDVFRPWLERIVKLSREEAEAVGYPETAYDALLDDYEPGITTAEVATLFEDLKRELLPLLDTITAGRKPRTRTGTQRREFAIDRQRLFGEAVAAAVGFDLERGRVDSSLHPFCTGLGPGDCRITARFSSRDFAGGFFGILHETGHALYEQGLEAEHYGTPMGEAASLGVHESQSRLWENLVGRSRSFWQHFYPRARAVFHDALGDLKLGSGPTRSPTTSTSSSGSSSNSRWLGASCRRPMSPRPGTPPTSARSESCRRAMSRAACRTGTGPRD